MDMINAYHVLQKHPFFSNFSEAQLLNFLKLSQEFTLNKGEYLIHEGENAKYFYIILKGSLEVMKSTVDHQKHYAIAHLSQGDTIGEMALIDQGERSASVVANSLTHLLRFSIKDLQELAKMDMSYNSLFWHIAKNVSQRLRTSNKAIIQSLEKQIEEYKRRVYMSIFMVNNIIILCLFIILLNEITSLTHVLVSTSLITLPITFAGLIVFWLIVRASNLPLSSFGITTKNWRQSVREALFYTSFLLIIILIGKWVSIQINPHLFGTKLFDPFSSINISSSHLNKQTIWLITLITYWLLVSPLQELIARGGLQGPLQEFLTGKYSDLKAILISNLIFSTVHIFLSLQITIIVFFSGLYFGWLYYRHGTLIGPILAHALMGTWGFWILGAVF